MILDMNTTNALRGIKVSDKIADRVSLMMEVRKHSRAPGGKVYTRKELAEYLGVSPEFVSQMLTGARGSKGIPSDYLAGICRYLEIDANYALGLSDNPEIQPEQEPEPIYFSAQADIAAKMIDSLPDGMRDMALGHVRVLVDAADNTEDSVNEAVERLRRTLAVSNLVLGKDAVETIRNVLIDFAARRG